MPDEDVAVLNDDQLLEGDVADPEAPPEAEPEVEEEAPVGDEDEKPPKEDAEEEEEDEKTPKDTPIHDRPTVKALKEKYPTLFKDFPQLKEMFFREKAFSEVFPTVAAAKSAREDVDTFVTIRDEVLGGSVENLFKSISETDQGAIKKIASSVLPALYKMSPDLHWQAILPTMENLTRAFFNEGRRSNDKNIQNAALFLSKYLFDDFEVAKGSKSTVPREDPRESEREKAQNEREKEFARQQFKVHFDPLRDDCHESLRGVIDSGANGTSRVDPQGKLTPGMKKMLVERIHKEIIEAMDADRAHIGYMNQLWAEAAEGGYTSSFKARIKDAFLARAKALVPSIRAKIVAEAIGNPSKNGDQREQAERQASRREPGSQGRDTKHPSGHEPSAKQIDWRQTSDMDLLNDKPTLKRRA